jgi:hypothetical protein
MDHTENPDDMLNAKQAAEYLGKKWGLPTFTPNAFRQYRYRRNIRQQGDATFPNSSMWRRLYLDQLPKPDETKRRKTPDNNQGNHLDIDTHTMLSLA